MDDLNDLPVEAQALAEGETAPVEEIHFFATAKDLIDRYSHCTICGSNLHFSHVTDFAKNLTFETARCPECAVRVRKAMHRLQ